MNALRTAAIAAASMVALSLSGCAAIEEATIANPFGDAQYTSMSGTDGGKAVEWLGTTPLTMSFTRMNGTLTMMMNTPCNAVSVDVRARGEDLVPTGNGTATAMGCRARESGQEHWATEFAAHTMQYTRDDSTLTLTSGDETIRFSIDD